MPQLTAADQNFLDDLKKVILQHIAEEQFGVAELADEISMSRSNLLRKVKKLTDLSVSQFIRNVRLEVAMELIKTGSYNVSEVGYKVGFSSTSYFIKCFREQYGFSPGETGKQPIAQDEAELQPANTKKFTKTVIYSTLIFILLGTIFHYITTNYFKPNSTKTEIEKSIAVLPFINDSGDSTNLYFVNGLMETTLNNLQKISDLKVISRTSSEKYRGSSKSAPEIAEELHINYLVEGSGQKIGNQIQLTIQLIDAWNDKHLWSKQYKRESTDIFALQQEIAKNIADEISAIVTPEEAAQIEKIPTENLVAYDWYLKGLEYLNNGRLDHVDLSVPYFEKAIAEDPNFAQAYANLAIAYYYMDLFQENKKYLADLNRSADKAMLLDPKLANSLFAKALVYMQNKEYPLAASFLEEALKYSPNSATIITMLSDMYATYMPNTEKYLEYALKGVRLDIAGKDSLSSSYLYLHLANALVQTGFTYEALRYLDLAKDYYPPNEYVDYVKAFTMFDIHHDAGRVKQDLLDFYQKNPTRLDVLQDIGKVTFMMKDYPEAYGYYHKFDSLRKAYHLDIYAHEDVKIAFICRELGKKEEEAQYLESYKKFLPQNTSIYKNLINCNLLIYDGNYEEALVEIKEFAKQDNYHFWLILFLEADPMLEPLLKNPEFQETVKAIKAKFWDNHERIKKRLRAEKLI